MHRIGIFSVALAALVGASPAPARAWEVACASHLCAATEVYATSDGGAAVLLLGITLDEEPILAVTSSRWRLAAHEMRSVILSVDGTTLEGRRGLTTEAGITIPLGAADLDRLAAGRQLTITTPASALRLSLAGSGRALAALRRETQARRRSDPWAEEPPPARPPAQPEGPGA